MEAKYCRKEKVYGRRGRPGGGANTVGGAMPLPWDLPLVGPLAEPVGVTPEECLEKPLGGPGVRGGQSGGKLHLETNLR